ncbi:MAG TPA: hypothetical protein VMV33_15380 [Rhodocyclaceae bacterium]|nr:hypothetical protein [Rhodocyclaceae bacterium]
MPVPTGARLALPGTRPPGIDLRKADGDRCRAGAVRDQANAEWDEALAARREARAVWDRARAALDALDRAEEGG